MKRILFFMLLFIGIFTEFLVIAIECSANRFDVNKHGFSFPNSNWNDICLSFVGTDIRYVDNSSIAACYDGLGLCGGMSLFAGERYVVGLESISLSKDSMKRAITDAQMRTITGEMVSKWMTWIASPDVGHALDPNHSVGYRMKVDWNNSIKPRLDKGEPVVIGLVRNKRARLIDGRSLGALADLASQHVVLAIGYSIAGNKVTIEAYDPNFPRDEIRLMLTLGSTGVTETFRNGGSINRKSPRGLMFLHGVPKPRAWHVSYGGSSKWQDLNTSNSTVNEIKFGDFNGDGKTDVFAAWGGKWHVSYGGSSKWQDLNTSNSTVNEIKFGDFNGDGKTDVFAAW